MTELISDMASTRERIIDISLGMDESLGWDTAIVGAVASDESSLDHEDRFTSTRESECDCESAGSGSDDDSMVGVRGSLHRKYDSGIISIFNSIYF